MGADAKRERCASRNVLFQPFVYRRNKCFLVHRLGHVLVEARVQRSPLIVDPRKGRDRQSRTRFRFRSCSTRRSQRINDNPSSEGNPMSHTIKSGISASIGFACFGGATRDSNQCAVELEQPSHRFASGVVVFDEQYGHAVERANSGLEHGFSRLGVKLVHSRQRQRDREGRTTPFAFRSQRSSVPPWSSTSCLAMAQSQTQSCVGSSR